VYQGLFYGLGIGGQAWIFKSYADTWKVKAMSCTQIPYSKIKLKISANVMFAESYTP
jgi:hypothetical protein